MLHGPSPAEALDRREVVLLMGETFGYQTQKFLPIILTDAGDFFGFDEYDGPQGDSFRGRSAHLMPPKPVPVDERLLAWTLLDAMDVTEAMLRGMPFSN